MLLVVLAGAATGCGAYRVRAHEATRPAAEEVAVVTAKHSVWETIVFIEKVDDVPVPRRAFRSQEVAILPGPHTLEVSYVGGNSHSTTNAVVPFEARAGRRYRVRAEPVRKGFWTEVGKSVAGGTGGWVAWVEDEETGVVVAGRKPHGMFTTTLEAVEAPAGQ